MHGSFIDILSHGYRHKLIRAIPYREVANVLGCVIVVNEFELHSRISIHFWANTLTKVINPLIPKTMGWIVPQLFYWDGFGIK